MANKWNIEPQNGVLTSSMDVNSREFKELQLFLTDKANSLDEKQKLQLDLFALQIKNEFLELKQDKEKYFQNFKLDDLMNG